MVDPVTSRTWVARGVYAALILFIAFLRLLPLNQVPGGLPGPDLMLALTFAWVLRRPAYVPAPLIVALFLPLDLILQGPPGLGTLLILLATEFLRARHTAAQEFPFPLEWLLVTGVLIAMVTANHIILALFLIDRPPLGLAILRALFTSAVYPFVVIASSVAFGIRRAAPGEVDALGHKL